MTSVFLSLMSSLTCPERRGSALSAAKTAPARAAGTATDRKLLLFISVLLGLLCCGEVDLASHQIKVLERAYSDDAHAVFDVRGGTRFIERGDLGLVVPHDLALHVGVSLRVHSDRL